MLQKLLLTTVWGRGIMVLCGAGILLRMITVLSYKRMKQAAEQPAKTKSQWVLLLKKRYESYEKFGRMNHVEAFVEHYFSRKGILGLPLSFWDKSALFLTVLTALTGVCGAAVLYNEGSGWKEMAGFLFLGAMAAGLLLILHIAGDTIPTKKQIVTALTDYLANGSACGAGRKEGSPGKRTKERVITREELEALDEAAVTEDERMVLEEVLEDYFW